MLGGLCRTEGGAHEMSNNEDKKRKQEKKRSLPKLSLADLKVAVGGCGCCDPE